MTNMSRFYTTPIKAYQFISRMLPANCRYYPTCSAYAIWQFETNSPHMALVSSAKRILSCNQFFDGGIDYPFISYNPPKYPSPPASSNPTHSKMTIRYWFVPARKNRYYVIKDIHETTTP